MNKDLSLWKLGGTALVVGILGGYAGGLAAPNPTVPAVVIDEDALATTVKGQVDKSVEDLNVAVEDLKEAVKGVDNSDIRDKLFEEDAWEAEAQVLAEEEFEDKDYKDLKKWLLDEFSDDFDNSSDIDDVEDLKVVVRDVTYSNMDVDDRDATVEHDLKVYYEDANGDKVKKYLTVTTVIDDNDVDDQEFEEQ